MLTRCLIAIAFLLILVACGGTEAAVEDTEEEAVEVTRVVVEEEAVEVVVEEEAVEVVVEEEAVEVVVEEVVVAPEIIHPADIVVLLIVDDFPTQELIDNPMDFIYKQPSETAENCIVTPSGQGYTSGGFGYTSGGFTGAGDGRPHGELILGELESLLNKGEGEFLAGIWRGYLKEESSISPKDYPWLHGIELWGLYDEEKIIEDYLLLVSADTLGFTTDNVMFVIDQVLKTFSAGLLFNGFEIPNIDKFVINMSFGIVPCGNKITDGEYADINEYIESIENESDLVELEKQLASLESIGVSREAAGEYIFRPIHEIYLPGEDPFYVQETYFANDKLFNYMVDPTGNFTVINVGAAGNFGDVSYPMAPAMWDSVVSVSADYSDEELSYCDEFDNEQPGSNDGEIKLNGHHPDDNCIVGTSFAAPRLSLLEAQYLLIGNEVYCDGNEGSSNPPLRYVDLESAVEGSWKNLLAEEAATRYCEFFHSVLSEEDD